MTGDNDEPPRRRDYAVGYGRPPVATRFRKGQSGNPQGRRRGSGCKKVDELALEEAYRLVSVRDGERTIRIPAVQAVLRAQIALAAKGNGPAQRALVQLVQAIEVGLAVSPAGTAPEGGRVTAPMSNLEAARRIAFILAMGAKEQGKT